MTPVSKALPRRQSLQPCIRPDKVLICLAVGANREPLNIVDNAGLWIHDPGFGSGLLDPGSGILYPGFWMLHPGSFIQDPGYRIHCIPSLLSGLEGLQEANNSFWGPRAGVPDDDCAGPLRTQLLLTDYGGIL